MTGCPWGAVMLLDDVVAEPRPTLRRLLQFLEAHPAAARRTTFGRRISCRAGEARDAARTAYPPMDAGTRQAPTEQYAASNARLAAFLDGDLSAWG